MLAEWLKGCGIPLISSRRRDFQIFCCLIMNNLSLMVSSIHSEDVICCLHYPRLPLLSSDYFGRTLCQIMSYEGHFPTVEKQLVIRLQSSCFKRLYHISITACFCMNVFTLSYTSICFWSCVEPSSAKNGWKFNGRFEPRYLVWQNWSWGCL